MFILYLSGLFPHSSWDGLSIRPSTSSLFWPPPPLLHFLCTTRASCLACGGLVQNKSMDPLGQKWWGISRWWQQSIKPKVRPWWPHRSHTSETGSACHGHLMLFPKRHLPTRKHPIPLLCCWNRAQHPGGAPEMSKRFSKCKPEKSRA